MRMRARTLTCLLIAGAVSCVVVGCRRKAPETEATPETIEETRNETETEPQSETKEDASKPVTYRAKDGNLSIKLPDGTWKAEKEGPSEWNFTSDEQGVITIVHYTGDDMKGLVFPASEQEVLDNLESAGRSKEDYAVVVYKKEKVGSYEAYHTTIKCKGADSKYAYSVAYNLVGEEDIYSVNGQILQDDAEAMEKIRNAVESLKLLKTSSDKINEKDADSQKESGSGQEDKEGQYVYDNQGNAVYVYQDGNGNWVDSNGAVYYFSDTGITNSSGGTFTYTQPSTPQSESKPTETNSFYDNEGNKITVYKDNSGNWVDDNGIIYTFGQYGVTDNYGNYYPYDGSGGNNLPDGDGSPSGGDSNNTPDTSNGDTNGFYDDQGNYITVYKDSNGHWVDSGGMEYTFGNSGVTDSYGNFYPY